MNTKLERVRDLMQQQQLAAYIVPNTDPHQSEYIAERWRAMTWLSGFDGSAGTLAMTLDFAGLWTDGRYFLQAEQQLNGTGIELMKLLVQGTPSYIDWLADNLPEGAAVGFDGSLFSIAQVERMRTAFEAKSLKIIAVDLIAEAWKDRPALPQNPIFVHDLAFAGRTRTQKIAAVRAAMQLQNTSHHLITALDDIAWLLNIRGNDVDCNPVAICYVLITPDEVQLFIDAQKISPEIAAELHADGVRCYDYAALETHLQQLTATDTVLLAKAQCSHKLHNAVRGASVVFGESIVHWQKAIKNEVELAHFRSVMVKDGAAMVRFFKWLEENLGNSHISELSAAQRLTAFRAEMPHFVGNSFEAISGYKGHGAIIHYRVTPETDSELHKDGIFLLDSGGQYLDGTTDITRTVTLGNATTEECRAYTAVLKAHIAVATAQFPKGTTGRDLHAICKQPLWAEGLDFSHGTGHGVGFFLNVHEGPQRIGNAGGADVPLMVGMVTSNEPGNYKQDAFGIRIENLIVTIESPTHEGFLCSETITLCPIDTKLIVKEMLTAAEIKWLNNYHETVFEKIAPHLNEEEREWLQVQTLSL
jgi:Xaa-Pro aminopeptidase